MNTAQSSLSTRLQVGIFSILGLLLIGAITVLVNNRPFWWRPCQLVRISVEDATGLKTKSPIRSLGIEIGYLKSVELSETHVTLGICITAAVEVLPTTRAFIRGEGFLGDKFVELKPVKYIGTHSVFKDGSSWTFFPQAHAQESRPNTKPTTTGRDVPVGAESQDVQNLVSRMGELVNQVSGLTNNLKQAINPEELRDTMKQLNHTLENASKTLAPEGGLNQTAQRSLAKLEDAIEQLRDLMTRVNKGEGSLGMILNDPTYAEEVKKALQNTNLLLNRFAEVKFIVDLGGSMLTAYDGGRGYFNVGVWPRPDRYYLLGLGSDSRGRISSMIVTTTAGGQSVTTHTQVADQTGLLLTVMIGKVFFKRVDIALGSLYGDGAISTSLLLGPHDSENRIQFKNDVYVRSSVGSVDDRMTLSVMPFPNIYVRGGVESLRTYNGKTSWVYGAGLTFTDEDIKLLFALK